MKTKYREGTIAKKSSKAYDSLNPRQKRFVDGYVRTGNGYKSAIQAGYTIATATQPYDNFLRYERVKKAIEEKIAGFVPMTKEQTANYIEGVFIEVSEKTKKEEVKLNAVEKLGKLKGLFTPDNATINVISLDETARAILEKILPSEGQEKVFSEGISGEVGGIEARKNEQEGTSNSVLEADNAQ